MISIKFDSKSYCIEPKFEIVCEIEEELGSTPELLIKFMRDQWKVSELVTLIHIILQCAGQTVDYMELGNIMVKDGLGSYLNFANKFLKSIIYK